MVADKAQVTPKEAERIIRILFDMITGEVAAGEKVTVSGFGTFERRTRKATIARNPKTGEPMPIEAQNVATFRAGSGLKEAVRGSGSQE